MPVSFVGYVYRPYSSLTLPLPLNDTGPAQSFAFLRGGFRHPNRQPKIIKNIVTWVTGFLFILIMIKLYPHFQFPTIFL